jgi:hypothetical protein
VTALVSKFQTTDCETGTQHFIEVYDQPLRNALVARLFLWVSRWMEPVVSRLDPYWHSLTHRRGCPQPQTMTRVADGTQTEPVCICMPLVSNLDYLGYRLARRNRVVLRHFPVDEVIYQAVGSGVPW